MDAQQPSKEALAVQLLSEFPSLQRLIRWRFAVAGAAFVATVAVTVWAFYAAAGASEFGPLVFMGMFVAGVFPLLLLGLLSLAIARGLGRPPRPAMRRAFALDLLILIVAVLALAIVLVLAIFTTGSALHGAAQTGRSAVAVLASMSVYYAIALLVIGLLLLMARGVPRTPLSAMKLALVQDLLILIVAAARVIPIIFPNVPRASLHVLGMLGGSSPWLWAALAVPFGAEAAYLLRARWQWRPAWPVFALLAAGLVSAGMIAPAVLTARLAREARPLLDYVTGHWVSIPPGARVSIRGQCRATPHRHTIEVQAEHTLCWIYAEHVRDGRWTCGKGLERTGGGGVGFGTFFLRSEPIRGVGSPEEAKELLQQCGVVDTALSFERATTEGYRSEYEFRSPLGQGRYRVNHFGHMNFYLEHPLEIP